MSREVETLVQKVEQGQIESIYLIGGEAVLAEPAGKRLAEAIAAARECQVQSARRPEDLGAILADLRTFSLFDAAKVVLVSESALFADRAAAADLLDDAAEVLPLGESEELAPKERRAASRLLQVLDLFGASGPDAESSLAQLPDWAFLGGAAFRKKRKNRPRGKKQAEQLKEGLVELLRRGLDEEIQTTAESDAADLGKALKEGLPEGHTLVLVESHVAKDHPIAQRLRTAGALVELGHLGIDRRGQIEGLDRIGEELERETGARMAPAALRELARRTLRKVGGRGAVSAVDEESATRLAAEYRKLASLAGGGTITVDLVEQNITDRGEEDVFELLDAIGAGHVDAALGKLQRRLQGSSDAIGERLGLFALLAEFCRQLVAIHGVQRLTGAPGGVRHYGRFKDTVAAQLQQPLPGDEPNPLAGLHPYRLHRVYLAASRLGGTSLAELPWRVLETETRLKGESGDPDVALAELVSALSSGDPAPQWTGSALPQS